MVRRRKIDAPSRMLLATAITSRTGEFAGMRSEFHNHRDTPTCAVENSGAKLATDEEIGGPPSSGH